MLALILGVLTVTGRVQLWQVFVLAAALGVATAFDNPTRQAFVMRDRRARITCATPSPSTPCW